MAETLPHLRHPSGDDRVKDARGHGCRRVEAASDVRTRRRTVSVMRSARLSLRIDERSDELVRRAAEQAQVPGSI